MALPVRKPTRIPGYDYSTGNYYFITICTHNKKCIFGKPNELNKLGKIADSCILRISEIYPEVIVDKSVVMPNHVHMILCLNQATEEKKNPSITQIVGQYKMVVAKKIHELKEIEKVWQRSFHDHVIRNQKGYERIWQYIEYNPVKWKEDCFYQI